MATHIMPPTTSAMRPSTPAASDTKNMASESWPRSSCREGEGGAATAEEDSSVMGSLPLLRLETADGGKQEEDDRRQEEHERLRRDEPLLELLVVLPDREVPDQGPDRRAGEHVLDVLREEEDEVRHEAEHEGYELRLGQGRVEQTHRDEEPPQEERAQVGRQDRAPLPFPRMLREDREVDARRREQRREDRPRARELGQDHLHVRHGSREERLDRPHALLVGDEAHRERGGDDPDAQVEVDVVEEVARRAELRLRVLGLREVVD